MISHFLGWSGLFAATVGTYLVTKTSGDPIGSAMITYACLSIFGFFMHFTTTH